MAPVRISRHDLQVVYSKSKCCVDGAAQFRAGLRSLTSRFDWESTVVAQTLQILVVNSFLAWSSITLDRSRAGEGAVFGSLDAYRKGSNSTDTFSDFIFDTCKEMVDYATLLD